MNINYCLSSLKEFGIVFTVREAFNKKCIISETEVPADLSSRNARINIHLEGKMTGTPICFITDSTYILPTLVAVNSLYINKSSLTDYTVFVLIAGDITICHRKAFEAINKKINLISVKTDQLFKEISHSPRGKHVSATSLIKFDLPEIFSQYDKLLYLDSDTLVQHDISDILSLNMQTAYAAAVADTLIKPWFLKRLQLEQYFNSGVMLLNIKQMRNDRIRNRLIDYRLHELNYYMDQDAFNVVFQKLPQKKGGQNIIWLPFYYNFQVISTSCFTVEEVCNKYNISVQNTWRELCDASSIIHFCSSHKPWEFDNLWGSELWYDYYEKLPKQIRNKYPVFREHHPAPGQEQRNILSILSDNQITITKKAKETANRIERCLKNKIVRRKC